MNWMYKLRLRVFAIVVGVILAAIGVLSVWALPVWSVVGVAAAAVAVAVNSMTAKLSHPTCYECGKDLTDQQAGDYGVICPTCGSVNHVETVVVAKLTERQPTSKA